MGGERAGTRTQDLLIKSSTEGIIAREHSGTFQWTKPLALLHFLENERC